MHKLMRAGVAGAAIASMLASSGFAFAQGRWGGGRGQRRGFQQEQQFNDVNQVPWAQAGIETMQAQGVLQGVAPDTFDPSGLLTRAEMAAVLGRLFGWNQGSSSSGAAGVNFADSGSIPGYALPYVGIASRKGILRGLPGGRFMPGGDITWGQLAVVIARAYNYPQVPASQVPALLQQLPNGASTPPWAAEAVAQDVQAGDFSGLLASLYQPGADVSRAELAQFLTQVEGQSGTAAGTNQNVLAGQITAVDGLSWTVQTAGGSQTVTVSPTASVFAESSPSSTAAVQVGDSVSLVEAGGQVVVVNITGGPTVSQGTAAGTGLTGTVDSVNASEMVLSLPGIPTLTLAVAAGASVTVDGAASSLSAVGPGQTVTVQLNSSGQVVAIAVGAVTGVATTTVATGTVVSFANGQLLLSVGGATSTYTVSPYATVTVNGQASGLSAVLPNETVSLTLSGGQVTAISVLSGTTTGSGLAVITTTLPAATVDAGYSQSLAATGGSGSYTWTYLSGSLPPGLSVNANGTVTGTPTAGGSYTFAVEVRDSLNDTATAQYTISVLGTTTGSGLAVITTTLPAAAVDAGYSQSLAATGGSGSYTWMYLSGSLPPGLSVNANGTVTGTPAAGGSYTFAVEVRDSLNDTATAQYTISVGATGSGLAVITTTLPAATVDAGYSQSLAATGGSGSYTWTYLSGSLPPGLSVNANGTVTGTPTAGGSYTFAVEVRDSLNDTATAQYTISVGATGSGLAVITTTLPAATVDAGYSQSLAATGGSGSYTWTYLSGSLPPGLSVNANGTVTGTPTAGGSYTFAVEVRDSLNDTATAQYTISVGATGSGLAIITTTLPAAAVNVAYSQSLAATGGSGAYTWTYLSGSLPPGLSVNANGTVTGTPAAGGSYTFAVEVRDSLNDTATAQYTISVGATGSGLAIATVSLPSATANVAYSQNLAATGGSGSYTWRIVSGSLPPGMVLSGSQITGASNTIGTYTFTVEAQDVTNPALAGSQALSITVVP